FIADGIFKAELNEFFTEELAEDGYSGGEVQVTPTRTEIIILATRTQTLCFEKVAMGGLCAIAQAERGVLGIKVKIMLPWDPSGKTGPKKPLPDDMSIVEAKDETLPTTLISKPKGGKPEPPACPSWYPQQIGLLGHWIWSLDAAL
ncbi:hypothetical protein FD755_019380, partial [Muntiacus reevesi]